MDQSLVELYELFFDPDFERGRFTGMVVLTLAPGVQLLRLNCEVDVTRVRLATTKDEPGTSIYLNLCHSVLFL